MNNCFRKMFIITSLMSSFLYASAEFKDGDYYLQNVATKLYLGGGNSYGTQASLIEHGQTIYLRKTGENTYTLDTYTYNSKDNHFLGANLYIDSQVSEWKIEELSDGVYTLSLDGTTYLACDGVTTALSLSKQKDRNAQWIIISEEERIRNLATNSDATFLIKAADFSRNVGPAYGEYYWNVNEASNADNINFSAGESKSNHCAYAHHTTFDTYQEICGIPNGTYQLVAQGCYKQEGSRVSYAPELYMEDESTVFFPCAHEESGVYDACTYFGKNEYNMPFIRAKIIDGTLTIGTRLEKNKNAHCYWDNFQLTYLSDLTLDEYKEAIKASYNLAESLLKSAMNNGIRENLRQAVDNKETPSEETIEAYKTITDKINRIVKKAKASIDRYGKFKEAYNAYRQLDTDGQDYFTQKTASILDRYESGLLTDGYAEIDSIRQIYDEAILKQTTPGTDMTIAIINPTIDGSTGWTTQIPNGGNGPLLKKESFEYWGWDNIDEDDREFNYFQTITGIQNGRYTVSCDAYNSMNGTSNNYFQFKPSCGLYASSGKKTVKVYVDKENTSFDTYTTPAILVEDGKLTIGVRNFNTMIARWFVADNFRLTLVESEKSVLGIGTVSSEADRECTGIFSVNGEKKSYISKGINIIRFSNGEVKKIYSEK